jgi:hypothetical protein
VKTLQVEARELQIHPRAQRQLLPARLKRLMANLDLDAIGALHVVRYAINGITKLWIVDGQHRWQTLMDHGLGEWMVTVILHCDVTDDAGASRLFLQLNDRSPVNPFDKFINALNSGDPAARRINYILTQHGIAPSRSKGNKRACCVQTLRALYSMDGSGALVADTLDVAVRTWGASADSMEGVLLAGLGLVLHSYREIDTENLISKLKRHLPTSVIAKGKVRATGTSANKIANSIIDIYNESKRSGKLALLA